MMIKTHWWPLFGYIPVDARQNIFVEAGHNL